MKQKFAVIPESGGGGYQTHVGNLDVLNLPDNAEIYDGIDSFDARLSELSGR